MMKQCMNYSDQSLFHYLSPVADPGGRGAAPPPPPHTLTPISAFFLSPFLPAALICWAASHMKILDPSLTHSSPTHSTMSTLAGGAWWTPNHTPNG